MYSVILVDDEEIIRRGMTIIINNQIQGFNIVETFEDGKEAIEFLAENNVDVVLTDINMTDISGLELAKYIYENKPETKTIIISGYKEFEYAKKAIEYNVQHYLLKPTKPEELEKVLTDVKEKLDEEKNIKLFNMKNKEKYEDLLSVLSQQFFTELILREMRDRKEISEKIELLSLDINIDKDFCHLISVTIDDYDEYLNHEWKHGKERLNMAICNLVCSHKGTVEIYTAFIQKNQIFFVAIDCISQNEDLSQQLVYKYLNQTENYMVLHFNLKVEIKIEKSFSNILSLGVHNYKHFDNKLHGESGISTDLLLNNIKIDEKSEEIIILKAKKYIDSNWNKDISLTDVAEHVFLNPAYFSRLFKQLTAENFIDYIIKIRIEKAIELMKEHKYKIYEISDKIGYKSSKYFTKIFKENTGYSPAEYSRIILQTNEGYDENG